MKKKIEIPLRNLEKNLEIVHTKLFRMIEDETNFFELDRVNRKRIRDCLEATEEALKEVREKYEGRFK